MRYWLGLGIGVACMMLAVTWAWAQDGQALVQDKCSACHDLRRVERAIGNRNVEAWTKTVDRMLDKNGAPQSSSEERRAMVEWLGQGKS